MAVSESRAPISRSASAAAFVLVNGAVETSTWVIMLPTVAKDFDASKTAIVWVVVAFALGMAGAGLAAGRLCDLIGLKRVGLISLVAEAVLISAIVVAPQLWMLYPLRFLQGVARAGDTNAAAATFIGSWPSSARGRVLGWRYSLVNGGQIIGVLFGGVAAEGLGWRAGIAILAALACIQTLLITVFTKHDAEGKRPVGEVLRSFDWWGAVSFLAAISLVIFSAQLFRGGTVLFGLGCLATAAMIFALAVHIERRASVPALDLQLFRSVAFSAATMSLMVMALCTGTANFMFPFYMQEGLGWSPSVAASTFLALGATQLVTSPISGQLVDRFGTSQLTLIGAIVVGASLLIASTLGAQAEVWQVAGVMLLMGLGMVVFQTPNNSVIFKHAGAALGSASAITGVYRFVGQSLGGAIGASFLTVLGGDDVVEGFSLGMQILGFVALSAVISLQVLQKLGEGRTKPVSMEPDQVQGVGT